MKRSEINKYMEEAAQFIEKEHIHFQKMEDIINRGGGNLVVQLWNSTPEEGLDEVNDVQVSLDSVQVKVKAGGKIILTPGESVCRPQRMYHVFWGEKDKGTVLIGEVSKVNDDYVDNRFYEKIGRFTKIEEDVEPLYLLYDDYKKYYKHT